MHYNSVELLNSESEETEPH